MTPKEAVGKVLEGWTLPNSVRKILEEAYFAAPQRTWVDLTDEQIDAAIRNSKKVDTGYAGWVRDQRREFARAIEAKLKEKNT